MIYDFISEFTHNQFGKKSKCKFFNRNRANVARATKKIIFRDQVSFVFAALYLINRMCPLSKKLQRVHKLDNLFNGALRRTVARRRAQNARLRLQKKNLKPQFLRTF